MPFCSGCQRYVRPSYCFLLPGVSAHTAHTHLLLLESRKQSILSLSGGEKTRSPVVHFEVDEVTWPSGVNPAVAELP